MQAGQTTEPRQSINDIIETGWHHFSVPPYSKEMGPRLYCWCGACFALPVARRHVEAFSRFLTMHADCRPNIDFLEGGSYASA